MAEDLDVLAAANECPSCGAELYDNRAKNKQRIAAGEKPMPDLACKDKCGWAKWPPRPPKSAGGGGQKYGPQGSPDSPLLSDEALVELYKTAFRAAWQLLKKANDGNDPAFTFTGTDLKEISATLYIAMTKARGLR